MNAAPTVIDLLRHGETEAGQRFIGSTDAVLTSKGLAQMQWLQTHRYNRIVTSPLQRCLAFAQTLQPTAVSQSDFKEIHFGDWENRDSAELWKNDQQNLSAFWNNPLQNTPPNGEPLADFHQRVTAALNQLVSKHCGEKILLVTHGGVIRSALSYALEMPLTNIQRLQINHGSLSRIEITHSDCQYFFRVLFTNLSPETL